jgi:hypothetical protein
MSNNSASANGGGIYNASGMATVTNSTLSGNSAASGGGAYNNAPGSLTLIDSTLSGNSATSGGYSDGGGIDNSGTVTVIDTTLSGNSTSTSSTLNSTGSEGGGIYNGGTITMSNSTLSGNSATASTQNGSASSYSEGGGIYNGGTITISNGTLLSNSASAMAAPLHYYSFGNNIFNNYDTVYIQATLLANSAEGGDCSGGVTDKGYNIDDDGSCGFSLPSISDYSTLSRTLGPLADNGGPTQTVALLPGTPAVDYVPAADCPPTDQRSAARSAPCDIGAYDTDTGASTGPCPGAATRCFTSGAGDSATVGSYFSFPVTTSGTPTPKIKGHGKLPKGVKFHKGIGSASLSGTPTSPKKKSAVGTYHLTITATFGKGKTKQVVTQAFTLTVGL